MELKVDGKRVFAATGGRPFDAGKPAILFLHGAGMDHSVWQLPARWFAWHGYSVLAVDLPGHGRSEGPPLHRRRRPCPVARPAARCGRHRAGRPRRPFHGRRHRARNRGSARPSASCGSALLGTAATIPVNEALLAAAREEPQRAYRMMTAWAHGTSAKLGGHPVPGLWMTGGTMALLARNQAGVLAADLDACNAWASGAGGGAQGRRSRRSSSSPATTS